MYDIDRRRQEGRDMAERVSRLLAGKIAGVEEDIRFCYVDDSFRLWWGERGDAETSLLIDFEQLRTLNNEELIQIIRSSAAGR